MSHSGQRTDVSRDFSSENIFRRIGSLVERPPIKMTQLVKVPVNMLGTKSSIGGCPEVPDNADEHQSVRTLQGHRAVVGVVL